MDIPPHLIELSLILFLLYWLIGGVLFALIALFRPKKIRKAQFSCLFTLLAAVIAIGAASTGLQFAHQPIQRCLQVADGYFASLAAVISCSVLPLTIAAGAGFVLLLCLGMLSLWLSYSKNQSWIDGRHPDAREKPGVIRPPTQKGE